MPKSGLSGSVRGAPSNGRPYRDTLSKPPHRDRGQGFAAIKRSLPLDSGALERLSIR
jgi:hypothetical protein